MAAAHDAAGAPLAPETIFHEYAPRVYHLAHRLLGNPTDAEDVAQEVFLQIIRKLSTFRGEAAFTTWLYRVTVNAALVYRRRRALREDYHVPEPPEEFAEDGSHRTLVRRWVISPEQEVLDQEAHEVIEQAIRALPEMCRDAYVLADIEELPNAEIGQLLGLSLAAVKGRVHRARLLLRKALAPYFEEQAA
jgi:RNA polymerase sigma-70 factor (ECF subfamily)